MAYTFGGNTADDINLGMAAGANGNNAQSFHAGWFYPTTLTTGRYYLSCGNTIGLGVAGTTSELTWTTANATTNGVWTSTTAAITTNKWHFIALFSTTRNTGPQLSVVAWVYDDVSGWRNATMAQTTAPAGNFTAGTAMTIGNRGTGTVAFQGDIGDCLAIHAGTQTGRGILPTVTAGTILPGESNLIYEKLVLPTQCGKFDIQNLVSAGYAATFEIATFHLDYGGAWTRRWAQTSLTVGNPTISTINGAVLSQNRAPNTIPMNWEMGTMVSRR